MSHFHVAVWIDHKEAKVFHVDSATLDATVIHAPKHHVRRHSKETAEHDHPADSKHYYHDVARAFADATEVLIVGPSTAKLELIKHVHKHDHELVQKIVGVETVDHPTDGQFVAYARTYFLKVDKQNGTAPLA